MKESKTKVLQAIRFFNGKIPATDLLEVPDGRKKIKFVGHQKTATDKFFDLFENKEIWSSIILIALTLFIASVAYWGIKQ
jgi:hypothetical protein